MEKLLNIRSSLPEIAGKLDDPKVEVLVNDGYMHIIEHKNEYDVIMVDSTEPVGPVAPLFERGFYQGIYEALKEDGIFVAQTDNPWFKADLIQQVNKDVKEIFPIVRVWSEHSNLPKRSVDLYDGRKRTIRLKWTSPRLMRWIRSTIRLVCIKPPSPKFVEDLVK